MARREPPLTRGDSPPARKELPNKIKRSSGKPLKKQSSKAQKAMLAHIISWFVRLGVKLIVLYALIILSLGLIYAIPGTKPISMLMARDALTGHGFTREWVDYDDIAHTIQRAVISAEDGRFCQHHGVDWEAVETVVGDAIEGKRLRGASTLSMQVSKNLFLWSDRSFIRKAVEVPVALFIDALWSKSRMLEVYLNIAEWGDGLYGVEAASEKYFGASSMSLTNRQAALLAAALPNPHDRNPGKPSAHLNELAGTIQARVAKNGINDSCLD